MVNLGCSIWVQNALRAGLVTYLALKIFYDERYRHMFRSHPGNFVTFSALKALEENCIVYCCELAQRSYPDMTGEVPFRRAAELLAHRTAISHPGRWKWSKEWMQKFHDAKRHEYDLRAAVLWDFQRSLNELAVAEGSPTHNEDILVTGELTALLDLILRCSMTIEAGQALPALTAFHEQLPIARTQYIRLLEKYPDGQLHLVDDEDDATVT